MQLGLFFSQKIGLAAPRESEILTPEDIAAEKKKLFQQKLVAEIGIPGSMHAKRERVFLFFSFFFSSFFFFLICNYLRYFQL